MKLTKKHPWEMTKAEIVERDKILWGELSDEGGQHVIMAERDIQATPPPSGKGYGYGKLTRDGTLNRQPVRSEHSPPDPLVGILLGLGHSKTEARAWAQEVTEGTPEERWAKIVRRKHAMQEVQRRVKVGMASPATLQALARQGCEKTAEDVATEHGIDRGAIEEELGQIRAYAEGAVDLGTGTLIMDHERGEVTHRIGSGLPTWLQDLGGPRAILEALERRAGKLYDDLLALAIANIREPVPF